MKFKHMGIVTALLFFTIHTAQATEVNIEWLEADHYRDIQAGNGSQIRFKERLLAELSEQFNESAMQNLPANHDLYLQVTDIDLAGRIDYFYRHGEEVRVIRNIDFPVLEFSFEIRDENNIVIASGEERIKDLGFNSPGSDLRFRKNRDSFYYEKELINDWFSNTFN